MFDRSFKARLTKAPCWRPGEENMTRNWKAVAGMLALLMGISGAAFGKDFDHRDRDRDNRYVQVHRDQDRDRRDGFYNGTWGYRQDRDRDVRRDHDRDRDYRNYSYYGHDRDHDGDRR